MPALRSRPFVAPAVLAACLLALLVAPMAHAQDYFGQNKVRYRTFDFKVLKTEHFDVYYYDTEASAAQEAARMAESWYARLSHALDHELSHRQPLVLYASHPEFEQTNVIGGELGEGTGGVTEALKRRIVLPLAGPPSETDHVIGHELVHAFQYDILGLGRPGFAMGNAANLPLWFMEGMAEYLSLGPDDPHTAMWMRDAAAVNKLPSWRHLDDPRYFPYRFGESLWAYIAGRWGEDAVGRVLKAAIRANGDPSRALQATLAEKPDSLVLDWHAAIRGWSGPIAAVTEPASREGTALIAARGNRPGQLNVAPALSPDGSKLMFISERGLFSLELYLADAHTGKVIRTLTHTAYDPHLQSLEFINSSGAWSPDGRAFALGAVSRGRPLLTIIDAGSGRTVHEATFPELGEILNPTWSPDGRRVCFSAIAGGWSDLFVWDLDAHRLRRLTNDRAADIEPAWSPDGRTIAFVTDRFAKDGDYRIGLMDAASGRIDQGPGFDDGKNINPQWSPDGALLYFISNHGGISNLYRAPAGGGTPVQLTNLVTGVSGITALSPAFTVARDADRLVFGAFESNHYDLYAIEQPSRLASRAPSAAPPHAMTLPPVERAEATMPTAEHAIGRVDTTLFRRTAYHPGLSLDYVSQPSLGLSLGGGGTAVGGGLSMSWSDMLGNHNVGTLLQFNNAGGSFLDNLTAGAAYTNQRSRWTWGGEASQISYFSGFFADTGFQDGGGAESQYRSWELDRTAELDLSYPFSRFQRIEFSGGLRSIVFKNEVETQVFDPTGQIVADQTIPLEAPSALNLGVMGGALVFDNTVFGGTAPVVGHRYRLGSTQVMGSLNLNEILADYRQYVMPARPLVFAGRLLHYGRYGRDAESPALSDLFLGYSWLVRGYNVESFNVDEGDAFNRLLGSRIAVANLEVRLPLLGALAVFPTPGAPPVEAAWFYDAGVAWRQGQHPALRGNDTQHPVSSTGAALRMNLFGLAVGEVDYVHPNDRPLKGWFWQFSLQPGF